MFGVCGFLAVSDNVFVSFKSASKPSAGLSCELMVACVTFQLLYMLLWNWSFWLLWTVRFCIVMLSSMYTTLRSRFLNIFLFSILIWFLKQVNFSHLWSCLFVLLFSFCVVVFFVIFGGWYTLSASGATVCVPYAVPCVWWVAMLFCLLCAWMLPFCIQAGSWILCCVLLLVCAVSHSFMGRSRSWKCLFLSVSCFSSAFIFYANCFIHQGLLVLWDSHLVMYYNSMIPQVSTLCFGSIISKSCTIVSATFFKWVFPWDDLSLVASSHLSYFIYLIVHSSDPY